MKKTYNLSSPLVAVFLVLVALTISLVIMFSSQGIYGGPTSYNHFLISKYAFLHPELFLDQWGKPIFTLVSAPFSMLGISGLIAMNIILNLGTAWFAYLTARHFTYKYAALAIPVVSFSPIFFITTYSGHPFVLAAFLLMLAIYLLVKNKFIAAAILVSFLPFVRAELFIFLPFFLAFFLMRKAYLSMPFLLTGLVLYCLIGGIFFNDFFYVLNQISLKSTSHLYGSGELLYYVKNYKNFIERPIAVLFLLGLVKFIVEIFKAPSGMKTGFGLDKLLILVLIVVFGLTHSIGWWKGIGGAYGMLGLMAVITPLFVFMTLEGLEYLFEVFKVKKLYANLVAAAIAILIIVIPFIKFDLPIQLHPSQALMKKAAEKAKQISQEPRCYYYDPVFAYFVDIDPYDHKQSVWGVKHPENPEMYTSEGDMILWDSHFGPHEGKTPLAAFSDTATYRIVYQGDTLLDDAGMYRVRLYENIQELE